MPESDTVIIPAADGERLHAWWQPPAPGAPTLVMAHGIGGIKAAGLRPFFEHFVREGFGAACFDYRGWGASSGTPRELVDIPAQRADYRAVLDWVRAQPQVDPERIVLWGTSFAGMHVVEIAAADPSIRAAIAQCPLVDGLAGVANVPVLRSARLTFEAIVDRIGAWGGMPPRYVPLCVDDGEFGVIATRDSLVGLERLRPKDGTEWPNRITARAITQITFARPVRRARDITCPILMVVASEDTMAPTAPAVKVSATAPRGELYRSAGGHYDVYEGGVDHENVLRVQTEFIRRHCGPGPAPKGVDGTDGDASGHD